MLGLWREGFQDDIEFQEESDLLVFLAFGVWTVLPDTQLAGSSVPRSRFRVGNGKPRRVLDNKRFGWTLLEMQPQSLPLA